MVWKHAHRPAPRSPTRPAVLAFALALGLTPRPADAEIPEPLAQEALDEIAGGRKALQKKNPPSPRISRYLKAAGELSEDGKPAEGQKLLDKLNLKRMNPHERAMVFRMKAYMSYGVSDYAGAVENFEKVLAEEAMTLETDNKIRYSIAQIHASTQKWDDSVAALERWFRYIPEPEAEAFYLMGISEFQRGEIDPAIEATERAVDLNEEPKEAWLQLLAALYIQKQDYASATPVFEELVMRFPKKEYWVQLSLIYGARDDYRASLAVQQVAHAQGLLTEDKEILRLARGYLYHDLPYPAASILANELEKGTVDANADFYELLANSWVQAREYERSLPALEKAAELSEDGNLFVRLGQVLLQREQWSRRRRLAGPRARARRAQEPRQRAPALRDRALQRRAPRRSEALLPPRREPRQDARPRADVDPAHRQGERREPGGRRHRPGRSRPGRRRQQLSHRAPQPGAVRRNASCDAYSRKKKRRARST